MIDFDNLELKHMGMEVPIHTRETIENYLIRAGLPEALLSQ